MKVCSSMHRREPRRGWKEFSAGHRTPLPCAAAPGVNGDACPDDSAAFHVLCWPGTGTLTSDLDLSVKRRRPRMTVLVSELALVPGPAALYALG
jgi:hypothetical protein